MTDATCNGLDPPRRVNHAWPLTDAYNSGWQVFQSRARLTGALIVRFEECHRLLGVLPSATQREIHRAYKRLAMRLHPDHTGNDPEARRQFCEVTEAYTRLSDALRSGIPTRDPPVCGRCGRQAKLYAGLYHQSYCADCLLNQRRRFLPAPPLVVVRCVAAFVLVACAAYCTWVAWTYGNLTHALITIGAALAALVMLSINVLSASKIDSAVRIFTSPRDRRP